MQGISLCKVVCCFLLIIKQIHLWVLIKILHNNREMADIEVVGFYNDRGESKRLFDEMNNDFHWKKMPFSFLHENTVFLIMMAICRNLFHFLTGFISRKLDFIELNFRLKKIIFCFIVVPSKWIKRGRQQVLKLFSTRKYHLLLEWKPEYICSS